jgi:predicted enzyme related to lactoylglutathione lyase
MSHNPVGWFELYVNDMSRAKQFYLDVFQLGEFEDIPMGDELLACFPFHEDGRNSSGALVKSNELKPGSGGTRVYFSSEDYAIETQRVSAAGGKVLAEKHQIGEHGFTAVIEDTEGNVIGLHSRN